MLLRRLRTLFRRRKQAHIESLRTLTRGPVFHEDGVWQYEGRAMRGGWYFWDETWSYAHGPYMSEDEAYMHLLQYSRQL